MRIKNNSKNIKKGDIFICTYDENQDRHIFIKDAIKNKAAAVITNRTITNIEIPQIKVENTNNTFYQIYNDFYNNPLENINLIGITGTDGKTTSAYICKYLLDEITTCAYLGTNGFIYKDKKLNTKNTTPQIDELLKYAKELKENQIENLVMEVSSEGLFHNRCENLLFDRVILTNVTGDHFNIHKTFENYLNEKLKLFDKQKQDCIAIINIDDKNSDLFIKKSKNYLTYGTNEKADYQFINTKEYQNHTEFDLIIKDKTYHIISPLLGIYNVYNLVLAIALLHSYNYDINDIINNIYNIKEIPGRMNIMYDKEYKIILDYAHTLNATKSILKYANKIKKNRIITVVGCAGGREKEKRKDIGKIITDNSDYVIFTMDDPRYEKVTDIIEDMTQNVTKDNYRIITKRKKAIKESINEAKENDIVLVLGKGIDNYMAIKNKYKKYCDFDVINKILKNKTKNR